LFPDAIVSTGQYTALDASTKFEIAKAKYKRSISKSEIKKCNNLKA
jgi:hypothetical protein